MRINKLNKLLLSACLLLFVFVAACQLEMETLNNTGTDGIVLLTIGDIGSSRTIMPETALGDFVRYGLFFTPNAACTRGNEDFHDYLETASGSVRVPVGNWDLRVSAYLPDNDDYMEAAAGTVTINVPSGQTVAANVKLLPFGAGTDAGVGTFKWDITFDSDITGAEMEFWHVAAGKADEFVNDRSVHFFTNGVKNNNTKSEIELPVGEYRVLFVIHGEKGEVTVTYMLHIYRNMASALAGVTLGGNMPLELADVVAASWNGSAWLFTDKGITAAHFTHLGIQGVSDGNFTEMTASFNTFSAQQNAPVVNDEEGLALLVDLALISIAAKDTNFLAVGSYANSRYAENAIHSLVNTAIKNGNDGFVINWETGSPNAIAVLKFVTGGSYYDLRITFSGSIIILTPLAGTATISGTVLVGETLSVNIVTDNGNGTIMYRWRHEGGTEVIGENSSYTVKFDDADRKIWVNVEYYNNSGHLDSPATIAVPVPEIRANLQTLTGTAASGDPIIGRHRLSAQVINLSASITPSLQWQLGSMAGFDNISGQTGVTYTLRKEDAGHHIRVRASHAAFSGQTLESEMSDTVVRLTLNVNNFTVTNNTHTYNGSPQGASVNFAAGIVASEAGAMTVYYEGISDTAYTISTTAPTNAGSYNIHAATADGNVYAAFSESTLSQTLTINKAPGVWADAAVQAAVWSPALTLAGIALPDDYRWQTPSAAVTNAGDGQTFAAIFTHPSGNYLDATGAITVNVARAQGQAVSGLSTAVVGASSISLNAVNAPNGQTVEYALSANSAAPESGWQSTLSFESLLPLTSYYVFARTAENTNYESGAAINISVTTLAQPVFTLIVGANNAPNISGGTIHRSSANGQTSILIAFDNPELYSGVVWSVSGITAYGQSFTVSTANAVFNRTGEYLISVEAVRNGIPFTRTVTVTVAE